MGVVTEVLHPLAILLDQHKRKKVSSDGLAETRETFFLRWHQKLHNNTTPDDVGICKAPCANGGNRTRQLVALVAGGLLRAG